MPSFISPEMARTLPTRVEDLVAIGDEVDVKIIKIDEKVVSMLHEGTIATSAKTEHSERKKKVKRVLVTAIVLVTTIKTTNPKRLYHYKKDSE